MGELSLRADFLAALGSATSRRAAEARPAGAGRGAGWAPGAGGVRGTPIAGLSLTTALTGIAAVSGSGCDLKFPDLSAHAC